MADIKISELASAVNLADTDVLAGVNAETTKKFSLSAIRTFFKNTFDGLYAAVSHEHARLSNSVYRINMPTDMTRDGTFALKDDLKAEKISYSHTVSDLQAENVQTAIDELKTNADTLSQTVEDMSEDVESSNEHRSDTNNPHEVTAQQINAIPESEKGAAGGIPTLNSEALVPTAQLPVFVGDVVVSVESTTLTISVTKSR